jgi:Calcineurin-like phosphoesterase
MMFSRCIDELFPRGPSLNVAASSTYILGDIHGFRDRLVDLLRSHGLVDEQVRWRGSDSSLWLLGDLVDRGPEGIEVIDLLRRLEDEAAASGGRVQALLGNHDVTLVAAFRFGEQKCADGRTFRANWERNGGQLSDLERLDDAQVEWIVSLPGMASIDDKLLIHADALFYTYFGQSIEHVNEALCRVLHDGDTDAWDTLIEAFGQRTAFYNGDAGLAAAERFLAQFGGSRIIHGHSPISGVLKIPPAQVTQPLEYAAGTCVNVDGGIYLGGPGFLYEPSAVIMV